MKAIKRKTESEKLKGSTFEKMTVAKFNELRHYPSDGLLWTCDHCHVLFEEEDDILVRHDHERSDFYEYEALCPLRRRFVYVTCRNHLLSGDREYFENEYHTRYYLAT